MIKGLALVSTIAVMAAFSTAAEARTRTCNAGYLVEVKISSSGALVGDDHAYTFKSKGGSCPWYWPTECRKKARNSARSCMQSHNNMSYTVDYPRFISGVGWRDRPNNCEYNLPGRSYGPINYFVESLENAVRATALDIIDDLGGTRCWYWVNVYEHVWGDKGCGKDNKDKNHMWMLRSYWIRNPDC